MLNVTGLGASVAAAKRADAAIAQIGGWAASTATTSAGARFCGNETPASTVS